MGSDKDSKALEAILERKPEDQETRLILADAYDDVGDPLAVTLRWMDQNGRYPSLVGREVDWYPESGTTPEHLLSCILPNEIFVQLSKSLGQRGCYTSVKAATEDLHRVLSKCNYLNT